MFVSTIRPFQDRFRKCLHQVTITIGNHLGNFIQCLTTDGKQNKIK